MNEDLKYLNPIVEPLDLKPISKQDPYKFMMLVDVPPPPNIDVSTNWFERTNRNLSLLGDYIDVLLFLRPFLKYLFPILRWLISLIPKSNSINFYKQT